MERNLTAMDVNDRHSIAFQFLSELHGNWHADDGRCFISIMGKDLGLTAHEAAEIVQYLNSLQLVNVRSGSRQHPHGKLATQLVVITPRGREHVIKMNNVK